MYLFGSLFTPGRSPTARTGQEDKLIRALDTTAKTAITNTAAQMQTMTSCSARQNWWCPCISVVPKQRIRGRTAKAQSWTGPPFKQRHPKPALEETLSKVFSFVPLLMGKEWICEWFLNCWLKGGFVLMQISVLLVEAYLIDMIFQWFFFTFHREKQLAKDDCTSCSGGNHFAVLLLMQKNEQRN